MKWLISFLFLCLAVLSFISCSTKDSRIVKLNEEDSKTIVPERTGIIDILGPVRLVSSDSLLIILTKLDTALISIVNLNNGRIVQGVKQGRGPGEVLQVTDICTDNNNGFLASGRFDKDRIVRIEDKIRSISSYSPDTRNNTMNRFSNEAFQGWMDYSPERGKVAIACLYSTQIEIYDIESEQVYYIKDHKNIEPQYAIYNDYGGVLAITEEAYICYRDLKIYGDTLYALFDGVPFNTDSSEVTSKVRVLDWEGNLIYTYQLDCQAYSIAIVGDTLCAATPYGVVSYILN